MRFLQRDVSSKRPYAKISIKKRQQLVGSVVEEGMPISKVAKKLRIKISTARLIVRKFKESGQFFIKNFKQPIARPPPIPTEATASPPSPSDAKVEFGVSYEQSNLNQANERFQQFAASQHMYYYYVWPWSMSAYAL